MPKLSSTNRYLVGKRLPQTASAIEMVTKRGGKRTVHLADGSKLTMTARVLKNKFNAVLQGNQKNSAMRSIRSGPDNTTLARIGGKTKGETRTYKTVRGAKAAITRRYPKAPK